MDELVRCGRIHDDDVDPLISEAPLQARGQLRGGGCAVLEPSGSFNVEIDVPSPCLVIHSGTEQPYPGGIPEQIGGLLLDGLDLCRGEAHNW